MMSKRTFKFTLFGAVAALLFVFTTAALTQVLTPQEELGRSIFFDSNLSEPAGQACASCHDPSVAFAEPDNNLPVSEGVIPGRFGTRNSPSAAYAVFFPEFDPKKAIGGQFWDGRAANLTEQAKGPFLNPVEMNNTSRAQVIGKIQVSDYANLFEQVYGPDAFADIDVAYHNMAAAIAAFEGTSEFNQFTSKFDYFQMGLVELTPDEEAGRKLYSSKAKCEHCHPVRDALFTDFEYHNIGLPTSTDINPDTGERFFPAGFQDLGVGGGLITSSPVSNGPV
jgi:cytochrome c peroxidase